jgi:hypothetical protein
MTPTNEPLATHRQGASRPTLVMVAATLTTFAGALVTLAGLLSLFARGPSMGGLEDVLHWAFVLFPPILLPLGVLDLVAARGLLQGRRWARIAALTSAAAFALFALFVIAALPTTAEFLLGIAWIAGNGFVIYALAVTGDWFAGRA